MTTNSMLRQNNITKDRLLAVWEQVGHPMSEPTLNKRLVDQQWSYAHAQLLKQLGVWVEPQQNLMTTPMMEYIFGSKDKL